jgi:hypothetical protein
MIVAPVNVVLKEAQLTLSEKRLFWELFLSYDNSRRLSLIAVRTGAGNGNEEYPSFNPISTNVAL